MAKGFTLLELLVVMVVLTLVIGLAVPLMSTGQEGAELRSTAAQMTNALRRARSEALLRNTETTMVLDLSRRTYWAGDTPESPAHIPPRLKVTFETAAAERIAGDVARIRFFPDGSSTGGRIDLNGQGRHAAIRVNWLTGQIAISE